MHHAVLLVTINSTFYSNFFFRWFRLQLNDTGGFILSHFFITDLMVVWNIGGSVSYPMEKTDKQNKAK